MRKSQLWALLAALALAIGATVVAGCGSSSSSTDTGSASTPSTSSTATAEKTATPGIDSVTKDAKIAASVPASIKSNGSLSVAADATYAPDEYIASDGKTVIGMDADLAKALALKMGLTANVQNIPFDSIIPGLAAGKYDLGMSSFTDTLDREKTVDFVTYASAGTSFYTKASGGSDVQTLADLCGLTVAVEKGTTQADDATAQSKKCTTAGKDGVTVSVFPDQNGANLALSSGRADVGMADSPVAAYIVDQSKGQFKLTGKPYGAAPYGIAMPKGNGMAQPVLLALKALIADGTYNKIFSYWGLQQDVIKGQPVINGATS